MIRDTLRALVVGMLAALLGAPAWVCALVTFAALLVTRT